MVELLVDEKFLDRATEVVGKAQQSIEVSTFKAEMTKLTRGKKLLLFFEKIKEKAKSGVKVRMILNWNSEKKSVPKTNLFVAKELIASGAVVRMLPNNRCAHAKILIVDKKTAIVGSHNLSVRSVSANYEISCLIESDAHLKNLLEVFDHSFSAAKNIG